MPKASDVPFDRLENVELAPMAISDADSANERQIRLILRNALQIVFSPPAVSFAQAEPAHATCSFSLSFGLRMSLLPS